MSTTAHGTRIHALIQHFESAALRLRKDGFSEHTSDRVALFVVLCKHGWTIQEAWADVNEHFPPEPFPTTQRADAGHSAPEPQPQPTSKGL